MLHTACPFTARALRVAQRRARFAARFGSFAQRSIDRRYSGILAAAHIVALMRHRYASEYPGGWFAAAVRLAGGVPSPHCWQPFARA